MRPDLCRGAECRLNAAAPAPATQHRPTVIAGDGSTLQQNRLEISFGHTELSTTEKAARTGEEEEK
jgi:hypothetical protein